MRFSVGKRVAFSLTLLVVAVAVPVLAHEPAPAATSVVADGATTFQPEIPVNEYWDYARIGNVRLYVNNTDRNVVYALDSSSGKIIWTFWAKDYGLIGYEIRRQWVEAGEFLLLTGSQHDAGGNFYTKLVVLDLQGQIRWMQLFDRGIDMPKMSVDHSGSMLLTNGGSTLWNFELATGRVIWKSSATGFYPYMVGHEGADVAVRSAGVGPGRWNHEYVLSGANGVIKSHTAVVSDAQAGSNPRTLVWDEFAKTVVLSDGLKVQWTVTPPHPLYALVEKGKTDGLRFAVHDSVILAYLGQRGAWQTLAFSAADGSFLWRKDLLSSAWDALRHQEVGDVLIVRQEYRSGCAVMCSVCPEGSWICADRSATPECAFCRAAEQGNPDYVATRLLALDVRTGEQLWTYGSATSAPSVIDSNDFSGLGEEVADRIIAGELLRVEVTENGQRVEKLLDVRTGLPR